MSLQWTYLALWLLSFGPPTLSSTLNPSPVCSGTSFIYVPASASPQVGYTWSRAAVAGISNAAATGEGAIDETLVNTTSQPITVTYTYTLFSQGTTNTQNVQVVVNPTPTVGFFVNSSTQCSNGNNFVFGNTSSIGSGTLTYQWNFGDGSTFNGANPPAHTFPGAGVIPVTLTATSSAGCSASSTQNMTIKESSYTAVNGEITQINGSSYTVTYTDLSSAVNSPFVSATWSFNDGNPVAVNPANSGTQFTFMQPLFLGMQAQLTKTDAQGCVTYGYADLTVPFVSYGPANPFWAGTVTGTNNTATICPNTTLYFTDQTNLPGYTYYWIFGDGSPQISGVNMTAVQHTYTTPGTWLVYEGISNNNNLATTSISRTITVYPGVSGITLSPNVNSLLLCPGQTVLPIEFGPQGQGTKFNYGLSLGNTGVPQGAPGDYYVPSFTALPNTNNPISENIVITATSPFGCGTALQTINVKDNPSPKITTAFAPQTVCSGATVTGYALNGTPNGDTWTWFNSDPVTGLVQTGAGNVPSITGTTFAPSPEQANVTITATDIYGCTATGNYPYTVDPQPMLTSLLTPAAQCSNLPFTYTPASQTTGITYAWSRAAQAGIANPAATGTNGIDETLDNTSGAPVIATYVYTMTANGCSNTQDVDATIDPVPALTVAAVAHVCSGTPYAYTPTPTVPGATYTWTRSALPGLSNPTATGSGDIAETLTDTFTTQVNAVYAFQLTNLGCTNTQDLTVAVEPQPQLDTPLVQPPVCSGTIFNYTPATSQPGSTYTWTRATEAGIANPAAAGNTAIGETLINTTTTPLLVPYEIALIAPDGCSNNQQVTTTVDPTPTLTPPADASQTVCSGVLTEDIPLTGPVPGTVYTWTNSNIAIGLPASGTGDVPTFQAANPGTATIQVLATSPAGCIATAANAATFTIDPTQAPQVTTPIGTLLCSGDSIPIDAIGANTYQWYVNGMPIGNFDGSEYDAYTPGVYTVTAITAQGCRDSSAAPTTVSLIPKPQVSFSFPSPWCTGQPVTLLNTTTGTPPITFLWTDTFGDTSTTTSPTFTYPTAGNIIMTLVATPDGCATSAGQLSGTLQVVAPAPGIDLPPVNTEPGLPTVLQAPNLGDSIVVWSPPTGLSDPAIQDPTATLTAPQTYSITMVTFQGCTTTDTLLVRVIPKNVVLIPSAFTPNGDGINDLFVIAGLNNYPGSSLAVYDRWGKQVYYSASYQNNWDGGNQPVGTYVYVLQLKISGGYKIFKGTLVIMR